MIGPDRLVMVSGRVARGVLRPPGSKSVANRYLALAAVATGTSRVGNLPAGDDVAVMLQAIAGLGATVEVADGVATITGIGAGPSADVDLDVRASGTTMRFLAGLAATGEGSVRLDGTRRMRERPIGPLADALRTLGADVEDLGSPGHPPIRVRGPLHGGVVTVDGRVSSQFVTGVLLAAPLASIEVEVVLVDDVVASRPYVDATLEAMRVFGVEPQVGDGAIVVPTGGYRSADVEVPPDASGAVYGWVAAAVTGGSVTVPGLGRSGTQADLGVLDALEAMGCRVEESDRGVTVTGPRRLRGADLDLGDSPDGALAVAAAAALADRPSRFTGLATLRVKETDRLDALEQELRTLGAGAVAGPAHLVVTPAALHGGTVFTHDDHRMAMSLSLLGLVVPGVVIDDPGCVAKTWPDWFEALADLAPADPAADVIAIDGPAGVGKSTVSAEVARRLGRVRLDTGAFYRAATLLALRDGHPLDGSLGAVVDAHLLAYDDGRMWLDGRDVSSEIRTAEVTARVSEVAAIREVRTSLVAAQRRWVAASGAAVVVEGRDVGTVVFPDAVTKAFLVADPGVRAARRAAEMGSDPAEELDRIVVRDAIDSGRAVDPLLPAHDAWWLDTSEMGIDEVVEAITARHAAQTGW